MMIDKVEIMKALYTGTPTIPELAELIDKANATVHKILRELVVAGLVSPPRKKNAARDYHLTAAGKQYLIRNGYIQEETNG